MAKVRKKRVYELAKELNVSAKKLLEKLSSSGIMNLKNFSSVDEPVVRRAYGLFDKD